MGRHRRPAGVSPRRETDARDSKVRRGRHARPPAMGRGRGETGSVERTRGDEAEAAEARAPGEGEERNPPKTPPPKTTTPSRPRPFARAEDDPPMIRTRRRTQQPPSSRVGGRNARARGRSPAAAAAEAEAAAAAARRQFADDDAADSVRGHPREVGAARRTHWRSSGSWRRARSRPPRVFARDSASAVADASLGARRRASR